MMQSDAGGAREGYEILQERAREASERAYAPYSGFHVGAALLTERGNIYTGVNVENASYGATLCAERAAVAAAVAAGEQVFRALAVYSPDGPPSPCGICRQVLCEFGNDMDLLICLPDGSVRNTTAASLLPERFTL